MPWWIIPVVHLFQHLVSHSCQPVAFQGQQMDHGDQCLHLPPSTDIILLPLDLVTPVSHHDYNSDPWPLKATCVNDHHYVHTGSKSDNFSTHSVTKYSLSISKDYLNTINKILFFKIIKGFSGVGEMSLYTTHSF